MAKRRINLTLHPETRELLSGLPSRSAIADAAVSTAFSLASLARVRLAEAGVSDQEMAIVADAMAGPLDSPPPAAALCANGIDRGRAKALAVVLQDMAPSARAIAWFHEANASERRPDVEGARWVVGLSFSRATCALLDGRPKSACVDTAVAWLFSRARIGHAELRDAGVTDDEMRALGTAIGDSLWATASPQALEVAGLDRDRAAEVALIASDHEEAARAVAWDVMNGGHVNFTRPKVVSAWWTTHPTDAAKLGEVPDREIAEAIGVPTQQVSKRRRELGIPRPPRSR